MNLRPLLLPLMSFTIAASALAAGPAPQATSPTQPLGGKVADAKAAPGQPRLITWEELVPKDWDPGKALKGIDLSQLDDSDPRANELLMKLQELSNNAPTNPALNGVEVKIPGFIVPLEENKGEVTEFLLVPYFGACIHTPPPPSNQIIEVRPKQPSKGYRPMDTVWVSGTLRTLRSETYMGTSSYRMDALRVEPYVRNSVDR